MSCPLTVPPQISPLMIEITSDTHQLPSKNFKRACGTCRHGSLNVDQWQFAWNVSASTSCLACSTWWEYRGPRRLNRLEGAWGLKMPRRINSPAAVTAACCPDPQPDSCPRWFWYKRVGGGRWRWSRGNPKEIERQQERGWVLSITKDKVQIGGTRVWLTELYFWSARREMG